MSNELSELFFSLLGMALWVSGWQLIKRNIKNILSNLYEWLFLKGSIHKLLWQDLGLAIFYSIPSLVEKTRHLLAPTSQSSQPDNYVYGCPQRRLEVDILTCEGAYCGATGFLYANHSGKFLGEPASNINVRLRYLNYNHNFGINTPLGYYS